jgi:hypothetical protein
VATSKPPQLSDIVNWSAEVSITAVSPLNFIGDADRKRLAPSMQLSTKSRMARSSWISRTSISTKKAFVGIVSIVGAAGASATFLTPCLRGEGEKR